MSAKFITRGANIDWDDKPCIFVGSESETLPMNKVSDKDIEILEFFIQFCYHRSQELGENYFKNQIRKLSNLEPTKNSVIDQKATVKTSNIGVVLSFYEKDYILDGKCSDLIQMQKLQDFINGELVKAFELGKESMEEEYNRLLNVHCFN